MVLPVRPALRPILLGSLAALVCGAVAAVGMLPGKVAEHARKAEVSATGSRLQIAVAAPPRAPVPASTGKLATMPADYADAGGAPPSTAPRPVATARSREAVEEAAAPADDEEEVVVAPRYARASARWRDVGQADEDAYDAPPAAYSPPRGRYRPYRRDDDQQPDDRGAPDDRYAPAPYLGERYYPPWRR